MYILLFLISQFLPALALVLSQQTVTQLGGLDKKRREEFKKHELNKAFDYKTRFRDLKPEEREQKLKEHLEKSKDHARVNHPVSVLYGTVTFQNEPSGECSAQYSDISDKTLSQDI